MSTNQLNEDGKQHQQKANARKSSTNFATTNNFTLQITIKKAYHIGEKTSMPVDGAENKLQKVRSVTFCCYMHENTALAVLRLHTKCLC